MLPSKAQLMRRLRKQSDPSTVMALPQSSRLASLKKHGSAVGDSSTVAPGH